jgi:peptidoglycan/LPS O-acetylase OafA/YrhL
MNSKQNGQKYLSFLDGLRGISILFVIFFHIEKTALISALPFYLKPFFVVVFENGFLGVMFFFIISGFLTRYHHKKTHVPQFFIKRYGRLFPAFVCAALSMEFFRFFPNLILPLRLILIGCFAVLTYLVLRVTKRQQYSHVIFWSFILLQLIAAVWYGFILGHQPVDWFMLQSTFVKFISQFVVNITLAVYLRPHITVLDGVYWTMLIEIIFIYFYPLFFLPFFNWLKNKKMIWHFITLICFSIFLFVARIICYSIPILNSISIENLGYFCAGIYIADQQHIFLSSPKMKKIISFFSNQIIIFFVFLANQYVYSPSHGIAVYITLLYKILLIIPLSLIFLSFFNSSSPLQSFSKNKYVVFIGTISYSIYLTHSGIIDGVTLFIKPVNIFTNGIFFILSIFFIIPTGWVYYYLIEKKRA